MDFLVVLLLIMASTSISDMDFENDVLKSEKDLLLSKYANYPNELIWNLKNVTEDHPLLFLHQRKAGGSSLRRTLQLASNPLNLTYFLPCHGRSCGIYQVPENITNQFAIYGGHFSSSNMPNMTKLVESNTSHSCLTNFREPVSRLISCIYFRHHDRLMKIRAKCLHYLRLQDLYMLMTKPDIDGYSCLNEPYRILSGQTNESINTHLGFKYNDSSLIVTREFGEPELAALNSSLKLLENCIPVVLEQPKGRDLLQLTYPDLFKWNAFNEEVDMNSNDNFKCTVKPGGPHMMMMRNATAFEAVLYNAVVNKVNSALIQFNPPHPGHLKLNLTDRPTPQPVRTPPPSRPELFFSDLVDVMVGNKDYRLRH